MNESLIVKWWWRFKLEQQSLWCKVVSAVHYTSNSAAYLPVRRGLSGVWNAIYKTGDVVLEQNLSIPGTIKGKLGNGETIRFWTNWWVGSGPLKDSFPSLFALENLKTVTVATRIQNWSWKRVPSSYLELTELQQCMALFAGTVLTSHRDHWEWVGSSDGVFSVASCRKLLQNHATPFYPFQWVKGVPKKVSIFMWRAEQDRLLTRNGLLRRRIIQGSAECKLCGDCIEDADHLFTSCYVASWIWYKVSSWCNIPPIFAFTVRDLLNIHNNRGISSNKRKWLRIVILAASWCIWKARNAVIFQGKRVNLDSIFGELQSISFSWINHKINSAGWSWETWKKFDVPIT